MTRDDVKGLLMGSVGLLGFRGRIRMARSIVVGRSGRIVRRLMGVTAPGVIGGVMRLRGRP